MVSPKLNSDFKTALKSKRFQYLVILILVLALPIVMFLVKQQQDLRGRAASPDSIELEQGVLSGNAKLAADPGASGGQYVQFGANTIPQEITPTPQPPPSASTGIYGSGVGQDALNNTNLGGNGVTKLTMRFRAEQSSPLINFRTYIQSYDDPGYGAGNGGIGRVTLQSDDGTSNHFPSGQVLATAPDIFHPTRGTGRVVTFTNPHTLAKGTIYHIVIQNVDPSPNSNYFSTNNLFFPGGPIQPKYGNNVDWGHAYFQNGAWVARPVDHPILDLAYGNNAHQGMGYMELGSVQRIGGSNSIRQRFTPTTTRTVSQVAIRARRTTGSAPLTVGIAGQTNTFPTSPSLPATSATRGNRAAQWTTTTLPSPVNLNAGTTYYLTFTAPSGTEYSTDGIRQGNSYGYHPTTYFSDGYAERNTGSGWSGFPSPWAPAPTTEADLQFYLK